MSARQPLRPSPAPRHPAHAAAHPFGMAAGRQVRKSLMRRMHAGDVLYARRLTHTRTVVVLIYAEQELAFLYSSAARQILRFLPPGAPEMADWRRSVETACNLFPRTNEGLF